jgi:hypothetical protein
MSVRTGLPDHTMQTITAIYITVSPLPVIPPKFKGAPITQPKTKKIM